MSKITETTTSEPSPNPGEAARLLAQSYAYSQPGGDLRAQSKIAEAVAMGTMAALQAARGK